MQARKATITITGISPFSPSRAFDPDTEGRADGETADDHERRIWRHRITHADDGVALIPAMAVQLMLQSVAPRLGKIPGQRNATYTKHFLNGILVENDLRIEGTNWQTVRGQWLHLNADGKRGGGTRVWRCMPMIDDWTITFDVIVLDPAITEEVFEKALTLGGIYNGFGRFAPRKGGTNGRYKVDSIEWQDLSI